MRCLKCRLIISGNTGNYTLLHFAVRTPYVKLTDALIDRGININAITSDGDTALYLAVLHRSVEHAKCLIDRGADANATNHNGKFIIRACRTRYERGLLLEAGAIIVPYPTYMYSYIYYSDPAHSILVAHGHPFHRIKPDSLPQYLVDVADGAFSRRKAAIRWWFWVHRRE
jgi:hypothetical protein